MLDIAPRSPSLLHLPDLQEDLRQWQTNRGDWVASTEAGESVLTLPHNPFSDSRFGVIAISGDRRWQGYEFSLSVRFTGSTDPETADQGWVGVAVRVQDTENYELFWLMPSGVEGGRGLAYVPVAHGLVPWWTHAYEHGPGAALPFRRDTWLPVRIRVVGGKAQVWAGVGEEPLIDVALTYYLEAGGVGVYCVTHTNAAFRRMRVTPLEGR